MWILCMLFGTNRLRKKARHNTYQLFWIDWFGYVSLESGAQSAQAIFSASIGGEGHRRDVSASLDVPAADLGNQFVSILVRHCDVGDEDVWLRAFESVERFVG